MTDRSAYVEKMKAKLDEWEAEIAKLEAKAKAATADTKIKYAQQVEAIRKQRDDARAKLEQLRGAGEDAWEDLKAGVESAWTAIGDAIKSAKSRLT